MGVDIQLTFILGTGRCGSTLLNDIMCLHRDTGFLSNYYNKFGVEPFGFAKPLYQRGGLKGARRRGWPYPNEGYAALRREVSPMLVAPDRDLSAVDATPYVRRNLENLFTGRSRAHRVEHVTHKFTGWPRAGLLAEVFPQAKFIHVVRDGRAVANSLLQQPWWSGFKGPEHWDFGQLGHEHRDLYERLGGGFEVLASVQWSILMRAFLQAERSMAPGRWLTVRYEDVVAKPSEEFARLTAHAGLTNNRHFEAAVGRVRFAKDRVDRFQRDLGPSATQRVEEACGPDLERLGYI